MKHEGPILEFILQSCRQGKAEGQRKLYELFYSYGMSVCLRYANNREEAQEILNDGFYKVFTKIDQYDPAYPFRQWLRVILIHAGVDYHRRYKRLHQAQEELEAAAHIGAPSLQLDQLAYEDVLAAVQLLPPAYRLVFNLYVVEGYMHHEIAEKLGISTGTSKSNLSKARKFLQQKLGQEYLAQLK
ncbi:MAG: RNA polymerase sigma factor [Saprospiraceae bacterium]|nr:RNA polymerase sigma factor [Saprospiraceae bacterium]MCB0628014.1 RNA polymerase sigma factor [Saprospiraceae bacterium]MCB0677687.1 RNA polymerase sigma factor [Saprospiraceae bacterium]MCB0682606.1 RNA polymerase sigma factor [Saprospiraceae bacterium]